MSLSSEVMRASAWDEVADRWDALNRACHGDHPLLTPEWIAPLLRHFGTDATRIVRWTSNDGAEAMALVELSRVKPSSFSPSQMPILPAVGDSATMAAGFSQLARHGRAVRTDLMRVDPRCTSLANLKPGSRETLTQANRTMTVSVCGEWDDYWSTRSKGLRKDHRRIARVFATDYPASTVQIVSQSGQMGHAVARYGDIEAAGWKGKEGSAIAPGNWQSRFYSDVMENYAGLGGAAAFFLTSGTEDVAARLAIWREDVAVILKTTYSERYATYRPGWLLLHDVLQWFSSQSSMSRVEFYTNASPEQLRWGTESRQMYHISIYRSAFLKPIIESAASVRRLLSGQRVNSSTSAKVAVE